MSRGVSSYMIKVAALALLAAALLGCGQSAPQQSATTDNHQPPVPITLREHIRRAARAQITPPLSVAQRAQANANLRGALPAQAYTLLGRVAAPAPGSAQVTGARHVSVTLPYSFEAGDVYNPGFAGYFDNSAGVTFTPPPLGGATLAPAGATYPDNFAYVLYRVDNLNTQPLSMNVTFGPSTGSVGIGAYNWAYGSTGRWEPVYFGPGAGNVQVPLDMVPGSDWSNAGGDMAFCVFCLNPTSVQVSSFELTTTPSNYPPTADLVATPGYGSAPLSTVLNATTSVDGDGTILKYRFDPLGDGNWTDNGNDPTFGYVYDNAGAYKAVVEVTDDDGATATYYTTVVARGPYDEIEPNDDLPGANTLPALPLSDFFGSCGPAGGYDGDTDDFFKFNASPGDSVSFRCDFSPNNGTGMQLYLYDSSSYPNWGMPLTYVTGWPPRTLGYTFTGAETGPFYINVYCPSGGGDYLLSGTPTFTPAYQETENNDTPGAANNFPNLLTQKQQAAWWGSLGSNPPDYPGYDGDLGDWYYFIAHPGWTLHLDGTWLPGKTFGAAIYDPDGSVLAQQQGDGGLQLDHTFGGDGAAEYHLYMTSAGDAGNYMLDLTMDVPNPGFSEQEDNDDLGTANLLPPVPFSGFTGNVGAGGSYDGDELDVFELQASPGQKITLTLDTEDPQAVIDMQVYDSSTMFLGWAVANPVSSPDHWQTTFEVWPSAVAPIYVTVSNTSGISTDYTLDAAPYPDGYNEVENNDSQTQANVLANYAVYSGSLGPGGYDGDNLDYYSFTMNGSYLWPRLYCFYNPATATFNSPSPPVVVDPVGNVMGEALEAPGLTGFFYLPFYQQLETWNDPYYLNLKFGSGTSDYFVARYY